MRCLNEGQDEAGVRRKAFRQTLFHFYRWASWNSFQEGENKPQSPCHEAQRADELNCSQRMQHVDASENESVSPSEHEAEVGDEHRCQAVWRRPFINT